MTDSAELKHLPFSEALGLFIESRKPYISPKTYREYRFNLKPLSRFFGDTKLERITADKIRQYQSVRTAEGCGPSGINHEGSILQQLLKRTGFWRELEYDYQPLPRPKSPVGRAMSDAEESELLRIAKSRHRWESLYLFILISLNTTAGPQETLTLRRQDVDLAKRLMKVNAEGAKNVHRMRPIPLNDVAFEALKYALTVAEERGSMLPEHYIFPFRISGNGHTYKCDPTRHAKGFRGSWEQVTIAAGIENLRMYDLRHTAISRLYENPENSEETIEQIAGHQGTAMKKRYAHIRLEAKRAALASLVPMRNEASSVAGKADAPLRTGPALTNQDVLDMWEAKLSPRVITTKINQSRGAFDTAPHILKQLQGAELPEAIILAMLNAE